MVSKFGVVMRKIRQASGDTLRECATKLGITPAFLSSMEVGRKLVPSQYPDKIKEIYNLSEEKYAELHEAMIESNQYVDIEISKMNEAQKQATFLFARKINAADTDLVEKLKKVLSENNNENKE